MGASQFVSSRGRWHDLLFHRVSRRARLAWRQMGVSQKAPDVEAAVRWLAGCQSIDSPCMVASDARHWTAVAGGAIATLAEFAEAGVAADWARSLCATQSENGAFVDAQNIASLDVTGQVLRGLLAVENESPRAAEAARRAADYLYRRIADEAGAGLPTARRHSDKQRSIDDGQLTCLPPLLDAARRWNEPSWASAVNSLLKKTLIDKRSASAGLSRSASISAENTAGQASSGTQLFRQAARITVQRFGMSDNPTQSNLPLRALASRIDVQLELGCNGQALETLRLLGNRHSRYSAVTLNAESTQPSPAGTALLAAVWYRLVKRDQADRAMRWLARHQAPDGGFLGRRFGGSMESVLEGTWTCKYFLDALSWQVRSLFDEDLQQLPKDIDTSDGRARAVLKWLVDLPGDARLVDVGCGKGRFLRSMAAQNPRLRLVGVDVSRRVLQGLPGFVETRAGSLLHIPYENGSFDGAMAVESLEHALLPARAIDELCRVVRPGGRVLVIDKNREHQRRCDHQPWERWFSDEEVAGWLNKYCDQVRVENIAHGRRTQPDGLFFCWTGRRRDT